MVRIKKAQMKIQQMSFMLLAVFLFFALVGMIFISFFMNNLKGDAVNLKEQNAKLLATRLASSPEFSCENAFGKEKTDCIDFDKAMVLKENIAKYSNFWGIKKLEVRKIYPKMQVNKEIECTKQNYPNCNLITLINKSDSFDRGNFVALCRKVNIKGNILNKCEMGRIIIGYE